MSFVPFRKTERRRRRPLDQSQIVKAALALLDDVGLDELTMRRLAERLGVKAASLYRHVRNKDELLVMLADEISAEIPLTKVEGGWREQLTAMAWTVRRGLLVHRDAARVLANTAPFGPRRLAHIESVLRTLREAGLSPRDAAAAAYHLNNFVTEFAADEARFAAWLAAAGGSRRKIVGDMRKAFASLPREEYPTLVDLADALSDHDPDRLFRFGVDVWLGGLASARRRKTKE